MSRKQAQKQSQLGALRRAKALRRAHRLEARLLRRMTIVNQMYQEEIDNRTAMIELIEALKSRAESLVVDEDAPAVPAADPVAVPGQITVDEVLEEVSNGAVA